MTEQARKLLLWHIRELEDLQKALPANHHAQARITAKLDTLKGAA